MTAATIAPTSGATMNSHTWLSAVPPTTSAGPRLRAGLTEVPVSGMPMRCTITRREADGDARRTLDRRLVGGEQDDHDEDGGEHHLDQERAPLADKEMRLLPVAVGTETLGALVVQLRRGEHPIEQVGADDPAGELGHEVRHAFGQLHPSGGNEAERHRGVHVAARDRPDGVDEGHEHQAEGEGGGHDAGGVAQAEELEPERLGGHPDGDYHQDQRAEKFCQELLVMGHG